MTKIGFAAKPSAPAPEGPLWAVGDVHGELPLLRRMLAQIPAGAQVILLGDYVDRGPDSAGVLRFLSEQSGFICLLGNHEEMLLDFLDVPERAGERWLQHGGLQTLESFGIAARLNMEAEALRDCRDAFAAELGAELISWLRNLPRSYQSGDVLFTHAGANPNVAADAQEDRHLTWGHRDFTRRARRDGVWVVHGHVIVPEAFVQQRRIAVDTGAYATGRLSAVHLGDGAPQFLVACEP